LLLLFVGVSRLICNIFVGVCCCKLQSRGCLFWFCCWLEDFCFLVLFCYTMIECLVYERHDNPDTEVYLGVVTLHYLGDGYSDLQYWQEELLHRGIVLPLSRKSKVCWKARPAHISMVLIGTCQRSYLSQRVQSLPPKTVTIHNSSSNTDLYSASNSMLGTLPSNIFNKSMKIFILPAHSVNYLPLKISGSRPPSCCLCGVA
jgi:hypothetical protein